MKNPIVEKDLLEIFKAHKNKKYFKKKNVIITGASGFIGFYLSKYLIKYFDKLELSKLYITCIDYNKLTKNFKKNKKKIFIEKFDVNFDDIKNFNTRFDIIIHAASIASPTFYRKFPIETMQANVNGLWKLLEQIKNKKTKVLFFSSSEIYGNPNLKNIPTKESYFGNVNPVGPRSCYDESKRFCETLCYVYSEKYKKITPIIVRPFNNYGPGLSLNDKRLPADLAKQVLNKNNINLFSSGKPKRSFCYISDAVSGYINAISYNKFEIFNIGNDKEITVKKFAETFRDGSKKILKHDPKIKFKLSKDRYYLTDNPERRCPDLSKSKKLLGYNCKVNIKQGIENYLNFLKYENKY